MTRQFPALADRPPVPTTCFTRAQLLLRRTVETNTVALLSGPAGCGKTYALEQFVASSATAGRPYTWLDMPPQPTPKELVVRTLKSVTGTAPRRTRTGDELTEELAELLHGSRHVLVVDEAHNLKTQQLNQLRYLHQRGKFTWTLVLAGSRLREAVDALPELATRATGLALFEPMTNSELLAALRAWHPLLAETADPQLRYIDKEWGRGNFRRWAIFLREALQLAPTLNATKLTDKLVAAVLTLVGADAWRSSR